MITSMWDSLVDMIVNIWDRFVVWHYGHFIRNNLLFLLLYVVIVAVAKMVEC